MGEIKKLEELLSQVTDPNKEKNSSASWDIEKLRKLAKNLRDTEEQKEKQNLCHSVN